MTTHKNLCLMHRSTAWRLGPRVALRYRRDGLFRNVSWTDYREQADRAAAGLIELGCSPGDRIAILSENRCEWLVADHAMLSAGATTVPLHAPLAPKQVEYQLAHSDSRGVIVSGQQQADKVFEVLGALPGLEFVISFEPIRCAPDIRHLTWHGLMQRGALAVKSARNEIHRREESIGDANLATIIYTSGTTGNPKGVMLSHGNLLSNALATAEASDFTAEDILLSWLPYSHIYARTVDHYLTTLLGATVCLSASVDALLDDIQAVRPAWVTAVPRFYEKVWCSVESLAPEDRRRRLHEIFGPRLRQLSSGGAPLPLHVCNAFFDAGIPLYEGYGLTESSPVISFNGPHACRPGSVGPAIPGVDIRIAEDGEILTRGPHVMLGYWKDEAATRETIVDGWLHTGDVGTLDDGFLSITGRKKDLIITSSGKNIAPSEIEHLLISDPCIDQAVVFGDGRPYICALLVPNFDHLREKADELGVSIDSDGEFIRNDSLLNYVNERVTDVMHAVSRPERVKKFLLLSRPLTLDADELTATLKVRRLFIINKFAAELNALYDESVNDCMNPGDD